MIWFVLQRFFSLRCWQHYHSNVSRLFIMRPFLFVFSCIIFPSASAQDEGLMVEACYVGEYFSNLSGGIKTGRTYQGLLDFGVRLNTNHLGLWKQGEFFALIENTHGGSPSANYLGDLQVASNIDNGDFTYLYELWYQHQFERLRLRAGLMDLNSDFVVSESAGNFLNSSFGVLSTMPLNMPAPIFPLTALGLLADYSVSEKLALKAAIYDGNPGDYENNRYNIEWNISNNDGFLYAFESHYQYSFATAYQGSIKLGGVYHSGRFNYQVDTLRQGVGNYALHLIAENTLIPKPEGEKGKLDAFFRLGYAPDQQKSLNSLNTIAGLCLTGLFSRAANDQLGLAFTHAKINRKVLEIYPFDPFELAIEVNYTLLLGKHFSIHPDFQYIINPGVNSELENAVAFFLRFVVTN